MSAFSYIADNIPGFISVALIFKGSTQNGDAASIIWLKDDETEAVVDINMGLNVDTPVLTQKMKSYLTGMAEIGSYLKARRKSDEPDVSVADIERAAIQLAFPRVARNEPAFALLRTHLNALQKYGVVETPRLGSTTPKEAGNQREIRQAPSSATPIPPVQESQARPKVHSQGLQHSASTAPSQSDRNIRVGIPMESVDPKN